MTAVSIVMGVYNGGPGLATTLDSLIAQTERDFELIVVDDGSNDGTALTLESYARRDTRVRVIVQENRGLTRALALGCAHATAPLIAREDSGDVSHPDRLKAQLEVFREKPETALVACSNRVRSPSGEELFVSAAGDRDIRHEFLHEPADGSLGIPAHPSAMFRRDLYLEVGGYRHQFYFAQDLDLWVRLAAVGPVVVLPEVLHETFYDVATISGRYRNQQLALASLIVQMRDTDSAEERSRLLEVASGIVPVRRPMSRIECARSLYFIGSCLAARRDPAARGYLLRSIRAFPLMARSWRALLIDAVKRERKR